MTDSLQDRGGRDRTRIDVHQEWELQYWSEKFGCTHAELKAAVKAVGTYTKDIEAHLSKAKSK